MQSAHIVLHAVLCQVRPGPSLRMARIDLSVRPLGSTFRDLPLSSPLESFVNQACRRATVTNGLGNSALLAFPGAPEHVTREQAHTLEAPAACKNSRSLSTRVQGFRFGVLPHLENRLSLGPRSSYTTSSPLGSPDESEPELLSSSRDDGAPQPRAAHSDELAELSPAAPSS